MRRKVILLGASGNIGLQTIDIIKQQSDRFEIVGLSVGRDADNMLVSENAFLKKQLKYICTGSRRDDLTELYPDCQFFYGSEGLIELTSKPADLVINALQGFVGLLPTLNAIRHKVNVALANKETLVCGGELVMGNLRQAGTR